MNLFVQFHCQAAVCRRTYEQKGKVWHCGSITLVQLFSESTLITKMKRLLGKKPKKSSKPSQKHIHLGILTNIAAGPLGFQAELNIAPKGE